VNVHTKNEKAIINANEICQIHGILSGFEVEDTNVATKKKVALNGHKQARQVLPMGKKIKNLTGLSRCFPLLPFTSHA